MGKVVWYLGHRNRLKNTGDKLAKSRRAWWRSFFVFVFLLFLLFPSHLNVPESTHSVTFHDSDQAIVARRTRYGPGYVDIPVMCRYHFLHPPPSTLGRLSRVPPGSFPLSLPVSYTMDSICASLYKDKNKSRKRWWNEKEKSHSNWGAYCSCLTLQVLAPLYWLCKLYHIVENLPPRSLNSGGCSLCLILSHKLFSFLFISLSSMHYLCFSFSFWLCDQVDWIFSLLMMGLMLPKEG